MFELLKSMIKEEWRIHTTIFGGVMFALFPLLIATYSFLGCLFYPLFLTILPVKQLILIVHYLFVFFGLSIGGFGLLGREFMNRRFGQASLLAYSSRTLPVSEKFIFLNFFIKDVLYYFALWILPFIIGFAFAIPVLNISFIYALTALISVTLSFLLGLSFMFLISTLYAHIGKIILLLGLLLIIGLAIIIDYNVSVLEILPSFSFVMSPSITPLITSIIIILALCSVSLFYLKVDYPTEQRFYNNAFKMKLPFKSPFLLKDFLDLDRSEGGLAKVLFSFLFPLLIVWVILFVFLKFVPIGNFLLIFSIFLGLVSSTIYNWVTEFDTFSSYSFLPIKASTVIKNKIKSYILLNSVSAIIFVIILLWTGSFSYALPALFAAISISAYSLAVTIYLGGLYPNILLYNARILFAYILSIMPILSLACTVSLLWPNYLLLSPLLIPLALGILWLSYKKWDSVEQPNY
ncbi:Uncharacterised protein [Candidatus Tiddalikarchaeum anstoanum]|nr:Uncharacterised protein [Candidatus Tiddalikarchaeum anstoanum]